MKKILVIAPHPDDETLGCGGTLLRHIAQGDNVCWLIVTDMAEQLGFSADQVARRNTEIQEVAESYGFSRIYRPGFPAMSLDQVPMLEMVNMVGDVVRQIEPEVLYIPYRNDAHSDHSIVFDAATACVKSFRYPSVHSVYVYETLSETEFGVRTDDGGFRPNLFIDIEDFIDKKISIMHLFKDEMAEFPFPRSEVCIRAQACLRGSQAGLYAAEAFMIIKEIR